MPDNEIVPFAFAGYEVRVVVVDGEPWWVARDVAEALGYSATESMTRSLDADEKGMQTLQTPGGAQTMTVISEPGLYDAIQRSTRAEAHAFKRWVRHDVLPEIRRTGSFGHPADDLALPTDYLSALKALVQREEQNLALEQQNAELTPRAIAWDAIASAEGDYSVGEAAKMLAHAGIPNMGPTRLFARLEDIGWTFRAGGAWQAKADRVEKGFLSIKPQFHYHPGTGARVVDPPQVRVTLKGVEQLRRRLGGGTGTIQAVAS